MSRALSLVVLAIFLFGTPALAADVTAEEVRAAAAAASPPDRPLDLAGKSLQGLDLDGLDLRRARLAGADLYGAKLDGADLREADLSGAVLNLAWIMRADFTGANLAGASLRGLVVSPGLEIDLGQAPHFHGASFVGAQILARLARFDLSGADFTRAKLGADMKNQSMGLMRTDFSSANLAGARFVGADLGRASLAFANLAGADLSGASLVGADLSGADLTDADLTNADATDADFRNAVLTRTKGLDSVKGLKPGSGG